MKILMTNHALGERAGSESYLETVSAELRRLGHEVVFFSTRCGVTAERFRAAGFEVVDTADRLPPDVDVIHGQHTDTVASVRTRLPHAPLVFAMHSWVIPVEDPVAELGAAAYLAFNDLTRARLSAHAATSGAEIVRLTQPVTVSYADGIRTQLATDSVRAVAVSRRMIAAPERLARACAEAGITFEWVGSPERPSVDAREEMRSADIVFAVGRTAVEAMAAGRATFVVDEASLGGWVTPASYAALEADGFTGHLTDTGTDGLTELLVGYDAELGAHARRLAVEHHAVQHHAAALVDLYLRVADQSTDLVCPPALQLLAAERYALEQRAVRAEWSAAERARELQEVRRELSEVTAQRDRFRRQRNRARRAATMSKDPSRILGRFRRR